MDIEAISNNITEHLTVIGQTGLKFLFEVVVALFILVIGLYLSRFVSSWTKKLLNKISFDDKTSKIGINELCVRFGLGKSPTYIISFILAWAVIFYAIVLAADFLHLAVIRDLFSLSAHFVCGAVVWQINGQYY